MGPKVKPSELDSVPKATAGMAENTAAGDSGAPRVVRLPADLRLVNSAGVPVSQVAIPINDIGGGTVQISDTSDDNAQGQHGPTPAKRRASVSSMTSFSREDSDTNSMPDYGPTATLPQQLDLNTMRDYMVSTNTRLDALASNMTGFQTWLQGMGPVLQQVAASNGVPIARVPTPSAAGAPTAAHSVTPGKTSGSFTSMSHTTVTTTSSHHTLPSIPSFQPIPPAHNTHAFNFESMNYELMQAMFKSHERKVFSAGLPLGFAIDLKLKEEVWTNKFVEFSELLAAEGEAEFQVAQDTLDIDPQLGIIVKKSKKILRTLQEWEKAFMVFVAVYTQKPDLKADLAHLFSYWWEIKSMAEEGADFILYDELFRKERAAMAQVGATPWDWAVFRQDLYNKSCRSIRSASHHSHKQFSSNFSTQKQTLTPPKGYCFDYHAPGRRCSRSPCTYKHNCPCGRGAHTIYTCKTNGKPGRKRPASSMSTSSNTNPGGSA